MTDLQIEYFGYLASFVVVASLFFHNQTTLRIVNSIGALLWVMYGFMLDSMPVVIMNIVIIGLNLRYLIPKFFPKEETS